MEIGNQIRKYRIQNEFSQEELAEKIYVSRQTISNWERGKNYPDIQSLLLMTALFGISLDQLVKGDVDEMKKEIEQSQIDRLERYGVILTILFVIMIGSAMPLSFFWGWPGMGLWALIAGITFYVACKVETLKKHNDLKTYQEITAFMEGRTLSREQRIAENAKWPYQKVLLAIGSALIALAVCALMGAVLRLV